MDNNAVGDSSSEVKVTRGDSSKDALKRKNSDLDLSLAQRIAAAAGGGSTSSRGSGSSSNSSRGSKVRKSSESVIVNRSLGSEKESRKRRHSSAEGVRKGRSSKSKKKGVINTDDGKSSKSHRRHKRVFSALTAITKGNGGWFDFVPHESMHVCDVESYKAQLEGGNIVIPESRWKTAEEVDPQILEESQNWRETTQFGDFEEFLMSEELQSIKDSQGEFVRFPEDDISITRELPRKMIISNPPLVASNHVTRCIDFYGAERRSILFHYTRFGCRTSLKDRIKTYLNDTRNISVKPDFGSAVKRNSFLEAGVNDDEVSITSSIGGIASGSVKLTEELLFLPSPNLQEEEEKKRRDCITRPFDHFRAPQIPMESIDRRLTTTPIPDDIAMRILLEPKGLGFSSRTDDPLWLEIFFYDVEKRVRVSETIYLDFNDDKTVKDADLESNNRHFVFEFPYVSQYIFLVAKVIRILKDDVDKACEPYVKGVSEKELEKWMRETCLSNVLLEEYRQVMAWGATAAFDSKGKLLLKKSFHEIQLWKMKPALNDDILVEIAEGVEKTKHKLLEGKIVFNAREFVFDHFRIEKLFTPSLYHLPLGDENDDSFDGLSMDQTVKIVQSFSRDFFPPMPHRQVINNLYIYPQLVNLSQFPSKFGKVKHVLLRVKYLSSDEDPKTSKFEAKNIFGRFSSQNFVSSIDIPIQWANKRPSYFEEVKIRLPFDINERHHLLFEVYSVNTKIGPKKKESGKSQLLGSASWTIWGPEKSIRDDKEYTLQIQRDLPNYYATVNFDGCVNVDKGSSVITFRSKLISSVFSQNIKLNDFFSEKLEGYSPRIFDFIESIPPNDFLPFFHVIFNRLIELVVRHQSANVQSLAFRALTILVERVSEATKDDLDTTGYNKPLTTYIQHYFSNIAEVVDVNAEAKDPSPTGDPTEKVDKIENHDKIISNWSTLITEGGLSTELKQASMKSMENYSYFFFALILRSMILSLEERELWNEKDRTRRFSSYTKSFLTSLVTHFSSVCVSTHGKNTVQFNLHFGLFINELSAIMDRGFVFSLINIYLSGYSNCNSPLRVDYITNKLEFLRVLVEYEHYIPLAMPARPAQVLSAEFLEVHFWRHHYVSGYLLNVVENTVKAEDDQLRLKGIQLLRDLLWKHAIDERFRSDPQRLEAVTDMYLPFLKLSLMQETYKVIKKSTEDEQREWYICFLYVLQNCNSDLVREWWSMESSITLIRLFKVFSRCIVLFKDPQQNLLDTVSVVTIRYMEYCMEDFYAVLIENRDPELFARLLNLTLTLLHTNNHEKVLFLLFEIYRTLIFKYSRPIFREVTTDLILWLSDCFHELIIISMNGSRTISIACVTLLYSMLKANNIEMGHFLQMKLAATLGIAKMDMDALRNVTPVLELLLDYAKTDSSFNTVNCPPKTTRPHTGSFTSSVRPKSNSKGKIIPFSTHRTRGLSLSAGDNGSGPTVPALNVINEGDKTEDNFNTAVSDSEEEEVVAAMSPVEKTGGEEKVESNANDSDTVENSESKGDKKGDGEEDAKAEGEGDVDGGGEKAKEKKEEGEGDGENEKEEVCGSVDRTGEDEVANSVGQAKPVVEDIVPIEKKNKENDSNANPNSGNTVNSSSSDEEVVSKSEAINSMKRRSSHSNVAHSNHKNKAKGNSSKSGVVEESSFWLLHVKDLLGRFFRYIHYRDQLPRETDPELKADILYQISLELDHSVAQRVLWLKKLAQFHEKEEFFTEAGQCKVTIAGVIANYFTQANSNESISYLPRSYEVLALACPNIVFELPARSTAAVEHLTTTQLSVEGYVDTLHDAVDSMVTGQLFEVGVELLAQLVQLHKTTGHFRKLIAVGEQLTDLATKATHSIESNTRLFGNYYRVSFFGEKWKHLHNMTYIYKEASSVRLADFTERLVKQFSQQFHSTIHTLANRPIEKLQIDPELMYIQVIAVDTFIDPEKLKAKQNISTFDRQYAITKFGFEAPFSPDGGKLSEDVDKQYKKRVVYITKYCMPSVRRRLEVVEVKEEILEPLDSAIDLIGSRIDALKLELKVTPPNTKTLQIVLQGSIMLQVNAGPLAICKVFLKEAERFDVKRIDMLRERLAEFVRLCDFALRLNAKLIGEDQREYQKAMVEAYKDFKTEAKKYLSI